MKPEHFGNDYLNALDELATQAQALEAASLEIARLRRFVRGISASNYSSIDALQLSAMRIMTEWEQPATPDTQTEAAPVDAPKFMRDDKVFIKHDSAQKRFTVNSSNLTPERGYQYLLSENARDGVYYYEGELELAYRPSWNKESGTE